MRKTQNLSEFLSKKKVIKHPGGGSVINGARFIGRGLKYLSAVSVLPLLYHMQATYELNRVAPLVTDPPVLTLPLGKIHPFAIYHFTLQQPLNKTCNFKTIFYVFFTNCSVITLDTMVPKP